MSSIESLKPENIAQYFSLEHQLTYVENLRQRDGMTRRRAECFVRLCAYLWLKERQSLNLPIQPVERLETPKGWVACSCREAALLFYEDKDDCTRGDESSARMMLNKLAEKGFIQKDFDGNTLNFAVIPLPEVTKPAKPIGIYEDHFDIQCDVIPVANLLAENYAWMKHTDESETPHVTYRIVGLLRKWASRYKKGMRVLRRSDNAAPVGFYLFFPTHQDSYLRFLSPPNEGLHLSVISTEVDSFEMAIPGDECAAVFIRSWVIDSKYRDQAQALFLRDAQKTLKSMRRDFPGLSDLYTLIIHPSYEPLLNFLGFQKMSSDSQGSIYWSYLALERFLKKKIPSTLPFRPQGKSSELVQ